MKYLLKGLYFLAFVAASALLCHYFFSWIGFNPTDEGFVLAASRRILDGQVPHIDFLSLRPAGSAFLHVPELIYGGEGLFRFSRLIFWIESAITAWLWVVIADKVLRPDIILPYRFMLGLVIFIFNVHSFPPMAWTTVDGLFLASVGIWLITHFNHRGNQVGYILLGCAALCKQNFLILIPGVFIIMGHFKRPYYILDAFLPILGYFLWLWRHDAMHTAMDQLFARHELVETGIISYVSAPGFFIGLAIPVAINVFRDKYKGFLKNIDFILVFDLVILGAITLFMDMFIGDFSFALFGFLLGYTVVHIKKKGALMFNSLILLVSWTVSISLGYNTTALASGLIYCALLESNYNRELFGMPRVYKYIISASVLAFLIFSFSYTRLHHVYKDNPAAQLDTPLYPSLQGGKGIFTNENVAASFREIDSLQTIYGDSLAVGPDYAAFWACSPLPNPLDMDWPNRGELEDSVVSGLFREDLLNLKGNVIIALQKYRASELHLGLNDLEDESIQFPMVDMLEESFIRIGETRYFYLYK